jgi:hypothetical protein
MLFFSRRRERKALKLARILVELDESARAERKRPPRRRTGPLITS